MLIILSVVTASIQQSVTTQTSDLLATTKATTTISSALPTTVDQKQHSNEPVKRFDVMKVEFTRVETPFIIGLWIFCSSLAKIEFKIVPSDYFQIKSIANTNIFYKVVSPTLGVH
ncbi:hypothetical protein O3M35_011177 [Rhynocoris fuscipes]|uniref:Uncharacterized protein n=1 Tax=Rhynocoris fuscipes TaxID=488301 RepID=A0AAW1CXI8_9HEMI